MKLTLVCKTPPATKNRFSLRAILYQANILLMRQISVKLALMAQETCMHPAKERAQPSTDSNLDQTELPTTCTT